MRSHFSQPPERRAERQWWTRAISRFPGNRKSTKGDTFLLISAPLGAEMAEVVSETTRARGNPAARGRGRCAGPGQAQSDPLSRLISRAERRSTGCRPDLSSVSDPGSQPPERRAEREIGGGYGDSMSPRGGSRGVLPLAAVSPEASFDRFGTVLLLFHPFFGWKRAKNGQKRSKLAVGGHC